LAKTYYVFKECPRHGKKSDSCKLGISDVPCGIPPSAKGIRTIKAKSVKDAKRAYMKHA
jgi:hypothetical protein